MRKSRQYYTGKTFEYKSYVRKTSYLKIVSAFQKHFKYGKAFSAQVVSKYADFEEKKSSKQGRKAVLREAGEEGFLGRLYIPI